MKEPKLISKVRSVNDSLPELVGGVIGFGVICEIIGLFFVSDKVNYSIGLWIGVIVAIMMSFHMAYTLNHAVERNEKDAQSYAIVQNLLRYFLVVVILGILMLTNVGNPLAAFAGIMGIKVSAYLQPLWQKLLLKISCKREKNQNLSS